MNINNHSSVNKNITTPNKYDNKYLAYDTTANKINSQVNYDESISKKYTNTIYNNSNNNSNNNTNTNTN